MTAMTKDAHPTGVGDAYDVETHPRRFPDPVPRGLRQAARLSRQRRLGAEAALGARGHRSRLHAGVRQRPSRPALPLQRARPRATRTRARPVRRFLNAGSVGRDHLHAQRHRGASTSSPSSFGAMASARATRSCSRSWSTTPTSCPGTSSASAAAPCSSGRRSPTTANSCSTSSSGCLSPAHQDRRHHAHVERARHGRAGQGDHPARARARHPGAGRRQPGGGAHAGRRARPRLRLLRLHRPQDLRPHRHRRALRQEGAPRRHAALSWAAAR